MANATCSKTKMIRRRITEHSQALMQSNVERYFQLLLLVLLIGLMTYAIRGIYCEIIGDCHVPIHLIGLAVGVISLLAYTPNIFLPQINSYIATYYEGARVYQLYFGYIASIGLLDVLATPRLKRMLVIKKG
jgi:hypothetical protein